MGPKKWFLVFLLFISAADSFSQICGYARRKRITIDPTKVAGTTDLTNFPVLINITADADLKTVGNGGAVQDAQGDDIVFTDYDGVTLLSFQRERYTATTGEFVAYVKVPTVSTTYSTYFYMYYSNAAVTTDQSSTGTWDSNYEGVFHFENNSMSDGTSNGNNATNSGSTNMASAQIAGGRTFPGTNTNRIQVPLTGMNGGNGDGTIELWGRITTYETSTYFFGETTTQDGSYTNRVQLYTGDAAGTLYLGIGSNHNLNTNVATLALNTWYHIQLKWVSSGSGAGTYTIYVNGVQRGTGAYAGFTAIHTFGDLGNDGNAGQRTEEITGNVDEARFSSIARSVDWLQTSYNNQSSPSTFYSITTPRVWTGSTNTVWSNTANWLSSTAPAANEDAIILSGLNQPTLDVNQQLGSIWIRTGATLNLGTAKTLTMRLDVTNCGTITGNTGSLVMNGTVGTMYEQVQPLSGSGTYNLHSLQINNTFPTTPEVKLYQNVNVSATASQNGTLTMTSGKINLNTYTLTLGNAAGFPGTLSYAADWMYSGTFTRWFGTASIAINNVAGHFPMGRSTVDYRPLWLGYSANLTTGGTVSVTHNGVSPSGITTVSYVDASWSGGTTLQGVSTSSWVVATANGFTPSGSNAILRFGGQGFTYFVLTDLNASLAASAVGTFGAATSVTVPLEVNRTALSGANLNNTWYIGTKNKNQSPLPVELTQFTAAPSSAATILTDWVTASETNNDYFTVERSKDAVNFEYVGRVNGAGTTSLAHYYHLVDESPYSGVSYYRLKQTDLNGQFTYSNIVSVTLDGAPIDLLVFPNPSDGEVNISVSSESEVLVVMHDVLGNEVFSKLVVANASGNTVFAIDPSATLAPGVYIVSASADDKLISKKLIIK